MQAYTYIPYRTADATVAGKCDRLIHLRYQSRDTFAIEIIPSARLPSAPSAKTQISIGHHAPIKIVRYRHSVKCIPTRNVKCAVQNANFIYFNEAYWFRRMNIESNSQGTIRQRPTTSRTVYGATGGTRASCKFGKFCFVFLRKFFLVVLYPQIYKANGALLARIWQTRGFARFRFASVRGDTWFL